MPFTNVNCQAILKIVAMVCALCDNCKYYYNKRLISRQLVNDKNNFTSGLNEY